MKSSSVFFLSLIAAVGLIAGGCSSDNSLSSAPTAVSAGNGHLEGQLVADTGAQFSSAFLAAQTASSSSSVYPLSGVTVELLQNGQVIATTVTDEYGRFHFLNLPAGEYDVRAVGQDGAVIHDHITVTPNQTVAVFGRVMSGACLWAEENGTQWEEMSQGRHWGNSFEGAAPGTGYWHDGQTWCDGSGPHGPHE